MVVKDFVSKQTNIFNFKNFVFKHINFFKSSPKKQTIFKQIQEENTDSIKSLVSPFDIGWSSLYNYVSRLLEVYPSIISIIEAFKQISESEDDVIALRYLTQLKTRQSK